MSTPTDSEILARYRDEPAPLLPVLHGFHDRDGFLSEEALRVVADGLDIPLADLYGTVTFYHHFSRVPGGLQAPRVCTGPVCCMNGAEAMLEELRKDGGTPMACSGRCDGPVPVLRGHETLIGRSAGELRHEPSPLPAPNPAGLEECCFAGIRAPERNTLQGYEKSGGFQALAQARAMRPEDLIAVVSDSKLAGRGGAGFPTGIKWKAVFEAPGEPKSVVCNADEGEPGCFKDRALMDHDPFLLLEGMAIAAHATGASRGFIYLRYEYPETMALLERCIAEAEAAGHLDAGFKIYLRRGAGAYVCGEEGSLLNSLEGKHPFPRNRPPFPVTHGFEDKPTAVNNVETLCSVPMIVSKGADWYRGLGHGEHAGTKLVSVSGDIQRPGNYEIPIGLPLRTLIEDWCGGAPEGRTVQAVTMAGLSGGYLAKDDLVDASLDEPSLRGKGSFLGAAGLIVFDDRRDMVAETHKIMDFFAHESCGKCFPCRIGTQRLTERLAGGVGPKELSAWQGEVSDISKVMQATSACGLGIAAPLAVESLMRYFPEAVARHVEA